MPDENSALNEAYQKVTELLEAAQSGAIIPIRLPGQIEEIQGLIEKAQQEHDEAMASALPPDMESYMDEEAYFVGHAVHELRTPMTSIRGYTDMLGTMGELNDMQKQFLDVVKTNARRMESLLADVSVVNKIRKGTLKLSPKMDMFKNIAMRVEKDMTPVAEQMNRQLELEIPDGLPLLNLDGDMLTIALNKLVENGLRYSSEGDGKVRVQGQGDGSTLVVIIEDNGIGMSPEDMEQLGTIYFRSDDDVVREYKGSGLGIPIAYGLVELLGGNIEVESQLGKGTKFIVRVPGMS